MFRPTLVTAGLLLAPTLASAQSATNVRPVTITFNGVVDNNVAQSVTVRQPDGTMVPYAGPVPAFNYQQGQAVTISIDAQLPTKAYFDAKLAAGTPMPSDGIFHVQVDSVSSPGLVAKANPAQISGGLSSVQVYGEPNSTVLSLAYNYNTDKYAIDGTGKFLDSGVLGAGYSYNSATGKVVACTTNCALPQDAFGAYDLRSGGDAGSITSFGAKIFDSVDNIWGAFQLGLRGSWDLSGYNGTSTSVPEPSMLALFGASSGLIAIRRRRKRAA